jgi:fatty-acyl-CoA synthase
MIEHLHAVLRMHQIGIVNLLRPRRLLRAAVNNARLGPQAALIMKAAAEHPHAPAVTDERGTLTYRELDEQSNALAHALKELGLPTGRWSRSWPATTAACCWQSAAPPGPRCAWR